MRTLYLVAPDAEYGLIICRRSELAYKCCILACFSCYFSNHLSLFLSFPKAVVFYKTSPVFFSTEQIQFLRNRSRVATLRRAVCKGRSMEISVGRRLEERQAACTAKGLTRRSVPLPDAVRRPSSSHVGGHRPVAAFPAAAAGAPAAPCRSGRRRAWRRCCCGSLLCEDSPALSSLRSTRRTSGHAVVEVRLE